MQCVKQEVVRDSSKTVTVKPKFYIETVKYLEMSRIMRKAAFLCEQKGAAQLCCNCVLCK